MAIKLPQPTFGFQLPSFNKKPTTTEQEAPMSRIPMQEKEPPMSRIPGDFSTPGLKTDLEKKFSGDVKFDMPKLDISSAWGNGVNTNLGSTPVTLGIQGTNIQQFPDEVKQSIGSGIQQQNLQQTQPSQATNPIQMIGELQYDIQQGATDDQIMQAYPELGTPEIISQLRYDMQQGATPEQIAQAYPELGIVQEGPQTTMQGGVKGGISRNSPVDMGQGEWINPIGKSVEELDNMVQKIGVIDFTKDRETALQQRIATLTPSELQDYKQEWEALKQNSPKIANLFQKTVKGKTLVGQMWNIITGDIEDLPQEEAFKNFVEEQEKSFVDQMVGVGTEGPKFANMMANIPGSALKTISAVARGMTNPVDTMTGLYKLVATPEGRQALGDRYGSWDAFAKTMEQDPVGTVSDIFTIIEGGANIVSKGSKLVGATDFAAKTSDFAKTVGSASDLGVRQAIPTMKSGILKQTTNLQTPGGKIVKKIADYSVKATEPLQLLVEGAKAIKDKLPTAESTLQRLNRMTAGDQRKFKEITGKTEGEWLNDNIGPKAPAETVADLSNRVKNNLEQVDTALEKIQGPQKFEAVEYTNQYGDKLKYQGDAIADMADDAVRRATDTKDPLLPILEGLRDKYNKGQATIADINKLHRIYQHNTRMSYFNDMLAGYKTQESTNIDSAVREWKMKVGEDNGFTNFREINKDTQASMQLIKGIGKREQGKLGNNAVTITDWIVAAPAMIEPNMLAGLATKKALQSNWFAKNYAKIINKINGHTTQAERVADLIAISKIQDEKAFQKWLDEGKLKQPALPYKEGVAEGGGKVIEMSL